MIRVSKPIGFLIGICLGIYTRDNYVYPYPLRVQDLEEDFKELDTNVNTRIRELENTINKMSNDLEVAQGVYVTKKHKMFEEMNESKTAETTQAANSKPSPEKAKQNDKK